MSTRSPTTSLAIAPRVLVYDEGSVRPPAPEGFLVLPQLPSKAFGDGSHPTTRLSAAALDFFCRQGRATEVLDVGTGTGVLARIARARGARFSAATEIDPVAIEAALQNVALDRHPREIPILNELPDHWGPRFQLVVANILEGPLCALASSLARAVVPGGTLLISGFTPLQISSLRVAFAAEGFSPVSEAHLEGWALLQFQR